MIMTMCSLVLLMVELPDNDRPKASNTLISEYISDISRDTCIMDISWICHGYFIDICKLLEHQDVNPWAVLSIPGLDLSGDD